MATQIGPKIGIEGEKEYRQQLKQIIDQTKNLDAAMARTSSEFTKNTSQMTKNKAVAQNLSQQIQLYDQKLEIMNQMLEESAAKFGESAAATQSWQRAIDYATAALNDMQAELSNLKGAENFSDVATKFADAGTKLQNVGQKITAVGQKMTMSLTLPIAAAAAASVKLASDLEESSNKVDVVFGNMSLSVKQFATNALNSYGLAESTALQMAGTFGAMATSMGLSQQQSAKMSVALTALAADMASFYNVSTEVAQNSLQGIFTGETEALKKFGIVMTQTNLEQFAADQGKVYSKMSEAEKVMTRYAFVMEATKDAQGDFGRTSDGTANSLRVFQESLKELGAAFGEQLLPVITPIVQALTAMIQKIASLPAPVQKVIVIIVLIVAAIGPLLVIIGTLMSSLGAIITQAPIIAGALAGLIPIITKLTASFGALTASAAPWLLLAAAIAAAGIAIYMNWDQISAAASELGSNISTAYDKMMAKNEELKNNVNGFVINIVQTFKQLPEKILEALKEAIQKIASAFEQLIENAKKSGKDFIDGFVDGIKARVQKVVDAVKGVAKKIEEYLGFSCPDKGPLHDYETWMPDFMQGLAKGINQNRGYVTRAIDSLAKDMVLPLDTNASMNMALSGAGGYSTEAFGNMTTNVYVDHINDLQDLIRIQNQAQQRYRMGAR